MNFITNVAKTAVDKISSKSPTILLAAGVVTAVAAVVVTAKETVKAQEIMDEYEMQKDIIDDTEISEKYTEEDREHDHKIIKAKTGLALAKNYIPAVGLTLASIGCFCGSYGVLSKRNLAITAAYNAVDAAYKNYRKAVREKDYDEDFKTVNGLKTNKIIDLVKEPGKKKPTEIEYEYVDRSDNVYQVSPYAKFFDPASKHWEKDPASNLEFLKAQESYATDLLRTRGYLYLNEVYKALDIPPTEEGSVVGWKLGYGDDYVDFGLYRGDTQSIRNFINGIETVVLLDFNVDGVIVNKL